MTPGDDRRARRRTRRRAAAGLLTALLALSSCAPTTTPAPDDRGIGGTGIGRTGIADQGIGGTGIGGTEIADRGIGGTGIGGTEIADRGIGGTGISGTRIGTARVADRGLGGTGITGSTLIADRGIGGTGIVGTITGFGSILVNGLRVRLPEDTAVVEDGAPADTGDLARGQVIVVTAGHDGAGLVARAIRIEHLATGAVTGSDGASDRAAPGTLRVAGQRVVVDADTLGPSPGPGDRVAASGFRRFDGAIVATRIDPAAVPGWSVVGVARPVEGGVAIGGAVYAVDGALPPDGARIRLAGTSPGRATSWTVAPPFPFPSGTDQLSVESLAGADGVPDAARALGVAAPATYAPGTRVVLEIVLPDDRGGAERGAPPGAPAPGAAPPGDAPPPRGAGATTSSDDTMGGHSGGGAGPGHEGRHNGRPGLNDPTDAPPGSDRR